MLLGIHYDVHTLNTKHYIASADHFVFTFVIKMCQHHKHCVSTTVNIVLSLFLFICEIMMTVAASNDTMLIIHDRKR